MTAVGDGDRHGAGSAGALSDARITAVTPFTVRSHYPRAIGRNARLGAHGTGPESVAVAVTTDGGVIGWGLTQGSVDRLGALVGRRVAEVVDPAVGMVDPAGRAADVALHDLAGLLLGAPVRDLLGAAGPASLAVYSGAVYFADLDAPPGTDPVDAVLDHCRADVAAGYRALKLKVGRGNRWMDHDAGLARDVAVTRAVRAALPDVRLLVDANDGWSLRDCLAYLDAVADVGLYWVEEPFRENAADLRALRRWRDQTGSTVLVADGEADPDVGQLLGLAGDGLLDVLLMDVLSFGPTAWRATAPAVRAAGALLSPHAWGEPLKTRYAAALGAGLGGVDIVEGVPGVVESVDLGGYRFADGILSVPPTPGFGIPVPAAVHPRSSESA